MRVMRLVVELKDVADGQEPAICRMFDEMLYQSPIQPKVRGWKAEAVEQRTTTGRLI